MLRRIAFLWLAAVAAGLSCPPATAGEPASGINSSSWVKLDVPYVPTAPAVVRTMLELAHVTADDVVYDLGSGDGRIVIAAVSDFGARRGVGVDLNPVRIAEANANAQATGVTDRVRFHQGDLFAFDFSEATVVTMYLLPNVNFRLRPRILGELRPGTRVVSLDFHMFDWQPDDFTTIAGSNVYLWIVPANVAGTWAWRGGDEAVEADLTQSFQMVAGTLRAFGTETAIAGGRMTGDALRFTARPVRAGREIPVSFEGRLEGGRLQGTWTVDGGAVSVTAALKP